MIRRFRQLAFLIPLLAATFAGTSRAATSSWTPLGPDGGSVTTVATDPVHPKILYAALAGQPGIYKSADAGASWSPRGASVPSVRCLAIDSRHTAMLYAGTSTGVFKSQDGGASWSPSRQGLSGAAQTVLTLTPDPTASGVVYAGTAGGVFKTVDGGDHWRPANGKLPISTGISALVVTPGQPNVLYVAFADGHGLYKSVNGGTTWAPSQKGIPASRMLLALAVDPRHASTVYAAGYQGLYKSTNAGASWSLANAGLGGAVVSSLVIDPQNPSTLFAGTVFRVGAFRSDDAGASWSLIDDGLGPLQIFALAIDPQGTVYAATAGDVQPGGVFQSTDGQTWHRIVNGLSGVDVTVVAAEATVAGAAGAPPALWAGTPSLGVFRSPNGGGVWRRMTGLGALSSVLSIVVDPAHPGTAFVLAYVPGPFGALPHLFKTTDDGRGWSQLADPERPNGDDPLHALRRDPVTGTLWLFGFGVARSDDGGATWTTAADFSAVGFIFDLAFDPSSPGVLYAGGVVPAIGLGNSEVLLYKSTDGGGSWTRIDGAGTPPAQKLLVSPSSSLVLYAASYSFLFRSVDAGLHWSQVATAPQSGQIYDLVATPDGTLYAATDNSGVYTSRDGLTWTAINRGLGSLDVPDLCLDPRNPNILYAGTLSSGVETYTAPR
ncbi:MAG TPA: hypothetical protein VIE43_05385 [Thermoanaerobaculia bacterium]|nr:hypothetical protein [Thermoanaerobaculia bacterium]